MAVLSPGTGERCRGEAETERGRPEERQPENLDLLAIDYVPSPQPRIDDNGLLRDHPAVVGRKEQRRTGDLLP